MPEETSGATTEADPLDQLAADEAAAEAAAAAPGGATAPVEPGQPAPAATTEEEPEWRQQFETPEEMWDRLRNVQVNDGRQRNELGEIRQQLALREQQLAALTGQGQQQQQGFPGPMGQQGMPQIGDEELLSLYDEDPVLATRLVAAELVAQMAEMQSEQLKPLYSSVNESQAAQTVERLKAEFGDDFIERHREHLASRLQGDPGYFENPQTRHQRLRESLMAAAYEEQRTGRQTQASQQPREANGTFVGGQQRTVHVEGGSGPAPSGGQEAGLDPIIQEMEQAVVPRDAYGGIPRHNPPNE